jgi:hypothetical protein
MTVCLVFLEANPSGVMNPNLGTWHQREVLGVGTQHGSAWLVKIVIIPLLSFLCTELLTLSGTRWCDDLCMAAY